MRIRLRGKYRIYALVISVIITLVLGLSTLVTTQTKTYQQVALVTGVVDGDTITIEGGQRVRLLGIDTRERGEPCYQEAKEYLTNLVKMKDVELEADKEDKDRYGRLLRYVWINGTDVDLEILKPGLAVALIIEPNGKYKDQYIKAEKEARTNKVGCLWK